MKIGVQMSRKVFLILIFVFLLSGCSKVDNSSYSSKNVTTENQVSVVSENNSLVSPMQKTESIESVDKISDSESKDNINEIAINIENTPSEKPKVNSKKEVVVSNTEKPRKTSSKKPVKDKQASASSSVSSKNSTESKTSVSQSTVSEEPEKVVIKATKVDEEKVAVKILDHINKLRVKDGAPPLKLLPGLTEYAKYRSDQLVTNFAHDTFDARAAATALKYGDYIVPEDYGITGEPYYTVNSREAIAMAGYVGTVDEIAEKFAILAKNSSGHWAYVGGEKYIYAGIGVTYEKAMWYCNIAVSDENTDN